MPRFLRMGLLAWLVGATKGDTAPGLPRSHQAAFTADDSGDLPLDTVPDSAPRLPGKFAPPAGEAVDCQMDAVADGKGLLLLSSSGLDDDNIKYSFRDLILQLPDSAWAADGAAKKSAAAMRHFDTLAASGFHEPELYGGLNVVVLEDPCFLKASMWDRNHTSFNSSGGINHRTAGYLTDPALVRPFLDAAGPLDGSWCVDWASSLWGGLGSFGFEASHIRHYSLFDHLAPDALKTAIFRLQTTGTPLGLASETLQADPSSAGFAEAAALLHSADVLVVNGGNPDFASFVLKRFAPTYGDLIRQRVKEGSFVLVGRSAGSMVSSADLGLTYEAAPILLKDLLQKRTKGLGLVGSCAIRPHYRARWELASMAYEHLKSLRVVRVPNREALRCKGADCRMTGATSAQPPRPSLTLPSDFERLTLAFSEEQPSLAGGESVIFP